MICWTSSMRQTGKGDQPPGPTGKLAPTAGHTGRPRLPQDSLPVVSVHTPDWIRTSNLRFRRPMLYPVELRVRVS
jgi:hypothetical protein